MLTPRITLTGVLLALVLPAGAQVIPTPGASQVPRTSMLLGQVLDATTGAPVPEAIVQWTMPGLPSGPATPAGRVMADPEGRFSFTELPAGEYSLVASKDGYASGSYRQRRVDGRGERLRLGEGEARADVTLRVWKYAVIGGTVVDETGEPVVGVAVRALVRRIVAGRPQYGTVVSYLVPGATTDDRGMFRLPRVEPGTYVVAVPSTLTSVPVTVINGMNPSSLRSELARAGVISGREPPTLGHPRTQQIGEVVLLTMSSVLTPPPPSADGRMQVYRTTYYPSATTATEATPFRMEAGEERTDLAIALRPTPAVRISGRLVAPDGTAPPPMSLRLVGDAMRGVVTQSLGSDPSSVGFETATGFSDATGRFTLLGVPPGEYVLAEANPFLVSAVRQGQSAYWLSQRITVGDVDLTDLGVNARPAFRLEGRLEFRGTNGLQALPATFGITTVVFETASGEPGQVAISANRQTLAFSTVAAGSRYIVRASSSGGWVVESITLDGRDITDRAFDLEADATSIVVSYTDRPTRVSGTVTEAGGSASSSAVVLAFPVDRQKWTDYGTTPRDLRSAYTTPDGEYAFDHLPPGEYHVVAIDDVESEDWQDPRTLAGLAARATLLTIASGDGTKTLDLTLRTIR